MDNDNGKIYPTGISLNLEIGFWTIYGTVI